MLEILDLSLQVGIAPDQHDLLKDVSARFPRKHFVAVLGPSGCGKSTLLKIVAGVHEPTLGHISWDGRDLSLEADFEPGEIGYVPQFSIAYELLTVWENVEAALQMRVSGLDEEQAEARLLEVLRDVGLEEIADRRVSLLSGGQKRRLALALELVSSPQLLLCDEVTSGLDPKAEDEIVQLLHRLSRHEDRIVLSVTHSLRHLALYDRVMVLYKGSLAYYGAPETLLHYFDCPHADDLFPRLSARPPEAWHQSWLKHRSAYLPPTDFPADSTADSTTAEPKEDAAVADPLGDTPPEGSPEWEELVKKVAAEAVPDEHLASGLDTPPGPQTPSAAVQFQVLFARRWRLFFRDRGQLLLQLALLVGFPILVVIFALDGLPSLKAFDGGGSVLQQIQGDIQHRIDSLQTGSLVSGLIMFQVVLLALTGSNNSAREIASERLIFEKEKFAGLRPSAYVASKAAFLAVLVVAQSVWMAVFVNLIVRFPGSLLSQIVLLCLVNGALTATCLGLSSLMKTAEQASLVSVYLVGFQLPLSGAVLALPPALEWLTRPVIASYWGWAGFIQTLRDTRLYDAVQVIQNPHGLQDAQPWVSTPLAVWVLLTHIAAGLIITYVGSKNSRWE